MKLDGKTCSYKSPNVPKLGSDSSLLTQKVQQDRGLFGLYRFESRHSLQLGKNILMLGP